MNIRNKEKINNIDNNWDYSMISSIDSINASNNELIIVFLAQKRNNLDFFPKDKDDYRISIKFLDILNIKIQCSNIPSQIMGLDIIDISKNQWEGINFRVIDAEEECIDLYCNEIEILSFELLES